MSDTTRDLLISLSSHMAYMQGQLEAHHQLDDLEDYYWYRESVALRQRVQRVTYALAEETAVPQGREPASVTEQPSDEEIMGLMPQQMHEDLAYAARAMANEAGTDNRKAKGFMRIALNRHAVDLARAVLARWGRPAPAPPADGEVDDYRYQDELRAARRPRPPSLAENVSKALDRLPGPGADASYLRIWADKEAYGLRCAVRRALERLQELENRQ
jgi:hypothetical protein